MQRFNIPGEESQKFTGNTSLGYTKVGKATYETFSAGLDYTVPGWYLSLTIPYVNNSRDRTDTSSEKFTLNGLGDISLMAWYDLTAKNKQSDNKTKVESKEASEDGKKESKEQEVKQGPISASPLTILIGAGLKFPTGKDDVHKQNGFFPIELQPGTGTLDELFGISAIKKVSQVFTGFAGITYQLTGGANSIHYEKKDKMLWNVGLICEISRKNHANISLGLNGTHIWDDDRYNGHKVNNTKGNWIYVSPAINIKPFKDKNTYLGLGINLPLVEGANSKCGGDGSIIISATFGF